MENPLLEVQQELRARKNRTIRRLFWSSDAQEFTIVPVGDEDNNKRSNFNFKPGKLNAKMVADYIEYVVDHPENNEL